MEKPFLFTDLIPPDEDTSKYDDEMRVMVGLDKGSIPIRTWNTGSPFNIKKAYYNNKDTLEDSIDSRVGVSSIYLRKNNEEEDSNEVVDAYISFEGMLNYKSRSPGDEGDDNEGEEDEDDDGIEEDVNEEEDTGDDLEYIPSYESDIGSYKFSNNQRVSTPLRNNNNNGYMSDNQQDDDEDDNGDKEEDDNEDEQGDFEYDDDEFAQEDRDDENNQHNTDAIENEKEERILNKINKLNQLKISPRVKEFIDYYSSESNYMNTQESKESEELINIMNEYNDLVNYLETPRGEVMKPKQPPLFKQAQLSEKRKGKNNLETDNAEYNNNKNIIKVKKTKEPKVKKLVSEDDGDVKPIRQKKVKSEIEEKNKAKLVEMVEKRRQEEEEIIAQEMKANAKRKKFKEALLEKAMRSRRATFGGENLDDDVVPSFLAPTKAFQVQSIIKTAKQIVLTDDDLIRQEEEKREKIAELRRKFKEQHKKILTSLASKNKESEKMNEVNILKEQKKKEQHKAKVLKILHSRTEGKDGDEPVESFQIENKSNEKPKRVKKVANEDSTAISNSVSGVRGQPAGLERVNSILKTKSANQEVEKEEESAEAVELRKLSQKLQQAKVAAYLNSLSEQKKKEDLEKKKKEERAKKRISLLSGRVLMEAAERKLMNSHDKPRYQQSQYESSKALASAKLSSAGKQSSEVKKITSEMADAITTRLTSKVTKPGQESNTQSDNIQARDFNDWKKKNSVPADGKVFAMTGWYPCVKQALLDRGWYYNPDPLSQYFNLKWTLRSIDVCQDTLQSWQFTNHYLKNVAITTKAGLIKSLRSLVWLADVDANDVIPRGYDLSTPDEVQAFIDDFRCQKAECILKKLYRQLTGLDKPPIDISSRPSTSSSKLSPSSKNNRPSTGREGDDFLVTPVPPVANGVILSEVIINKAVLDAAFSILEKQIRPYSDSYIDNGDSINSAKLVSDLEWELIGSYNIDAKVKSLPSFSPDPIDIFLREKEDLDSKLNASQVKEKRRLQRVDQDSRDVASKDISVMKSIDENDLSRIHSILCTLFYYGKSQNGLNGKGSQANNMWIVKPAAKSRGRGIATFMDLPKLLRYVEAGSGFSTQWVVQKYMENPLIIGKRKFDLRQWVLVTNWNPLTVYFYDEFYARFSVEEYSNDVNDLENSFVHLVNNSIGKNSENFGKSFLAENGESIDGYMWSFDSFKKYIEDQSGNDYVTEKIQPRMKDIAKWSLMCASEMIEHRKNSWELYGFDFMVDDDYNAWLIEINSSPACDYSTKVTERYVQKALVEILSVVFDCRDWEAQPKKNRGPKPDTGGWINIYEGPLLDMPVGAFGLDMSVKGEGFKSLPRKTIQSNYASSNIVFANEDGNANSPNRNSSKRIINASPPGSPINKPRQPINSRRASVNNTPPASPSNKTRIPLNTKRSNIVSSPPSSPLNKQNRKPVISGRRVLSAGNGSSNKNKVNEENKDNFNDSDDESLKEEKKKKNLINNTNNKSSSAAVSAIPIKVFSMDF